jgi:hypothetical protein
MGGQHGSLTAASRAVPLFSVGEHFSIRDYFAAMAAAVAAARNASSQLPQSLPLSGALPGALPAPASGSASGGTGLDLSGALALLLSALLCAKFLWYLRDYLKPDSAYGLIVNQPG